MTRIRTPAQDLQKDLHNHEFRHLYLAEVIRSSIALQVTEMRVARGWSQDELARRAGMRQEVISQVENPNGARLTIRTLRRLAGAFDVALEVRFAPFVQLEELVKNLAAIGGDCLSFEEEDGLLHEKLD